MYYQDYDKLDGNERSLYRQGMAAFGGVAPTYHIELRDRPTLIWDFNSLLLCIQMMFSFMLTDNNSSLKVCKHCGKAFVATRSNMEFCSPQCKNRYNEIYATSIDYDPHAENSVLFFKQVQNKLHWAAHKHTDAEVIYKRADTDFSQEATN